jgi:hydrogenase/urease accessory protein HupE
VSGLRRLVVFVFVGACALAAWQREATAHPLSPNLLELRELAAGRAEVLWKVNAGADGDRTNATAVLPPACRTISNPAGAVVTRGVVQRYVVDCGGAGLAGQTVAVTGLGGPGGEEALLRVALADGRRLSAVLRASAPSFVIPATASRPAISSSYVALGVHHILTGHDHLAFVLGLVLLVAGLGALVRTVTAFTVAHSVTLSLGALEVLRLLAAAVEAVIALSILFLALELVRPRGLPPSVAGRHPWAVAFAFGLLHGFGFAGALADVGLPSGEIPLALLSFNVGVEIGQLCFVLAVIAARALLERQPRLAAALPRAPAYAIGALARFWCLERLTSFWR